MDHIHRDDIKIRLESLLLATPESEAVGIRLVIESFCHRKMGSSPTTLTIDDIKPQMTALHLATGETDVRWGIALAAIALGITPNTKLRNML